MSPHSLPKESTSATPVAASSSTAPRAKVSAEDTAHTVGSSSTRSAPPSRASRARVHLSAAAGRPPWVQWPLMTATAGASSPSRALVPASWCPWPVWNGSYSATTPMTAIFGSPSKISAPVKKTVVSRGEKY